MDSDLTVVLHGANETLTKAENRALLLEPGECEIEVTNEKNGELVRKGKIHVLPSAKQSVQIPLWKNTAPLPEQREPLATLLGHSRIVNHAVFSPNGNMLATASEDGTAKLWQRDSAAWRLLHTLEGHKGLLRTAAFSPDDKTVVTGGKDGDLRIWDATSGELIKLVAAHPSTIWWVAFSPDGSHCASACNDGTVKLWDASTWQQRLRLIAHAEAVKCVAFSPDGKLLATASVDGTAKLWVVASREKLRTLCGHTSTVWSVAFSPDGRSLVSSGSDAMIFLWDVATGVATDRIASDSYCFSTVFSPDGRTIASTGDGTVRLWDRATGAQIDKFHSHWSWSATIAFSPDGRFFVTSSDDNTAKVWTTPELLPTTTVGKMAPPQPKITFHIKNRGQCASVFAFSKSDPDVLAVGTYGEKTIRLWHLKEQRYLKQFDAHAGALRCLHYLSEGTLVSSGQINDKVVGLRLWHADSLELMRSVPLQKSPGSMAATPDGKSLAVSQWGFGDVAMVDIETGKSTFVVPSRCRDQECGKQTSVTLSPDGKILAAGSKLGFVTLWDPRSGDAMGKPLSHGEAMIWEVVFSPDGRTLASASNDSTVKLWNLSDPESPAELAMLKQHSGCVYDVAFSPDGKLLVSVGGDDAHGFEFAHLGEAKIWDVASHRLLAALGGHTEGVFYTGFSPDGKVLATSGLDEKICLWDVAELLTCGDTRLPNGNSLAEQNGYEYSHPDPLQRAKQAPTSPR
ncbi:MAG: hypothetical protein GXY83_33830 [Rhodopirellula sp.]|nr:hypothetical protein [Rhodopirellula sp.]